MENELRRVVDALPGLVWTARADGHIDFLNQRWCEYTGLSVDEAYSERWQTAIHPEDLPGLLERWRSILASGELCEMEARLRRFDGEYRPCDGPLACDDLAHTVRRHMKLPGKLGRRPSSLNSNSRVRICRWVSVALAKSPRTVAAVAFCMASA